MNYRILLFFSLFFTIGSLSFCLDLKAAMISALDSIHAHDWDKTERLINRIEREAPRHPYGSFLQVYQEFWQTVLYRKFDSEDALVSQFYKTSIETVHTLLSAELQRVEEAQLLAGCVFLFIAYRDFISDNMLRGLYYIQRAVKTTSSIEAGSPVWYDAQGLQGLARYYSIGQERTWLEKVDEAIRYGTLFSDLYLFFKGKILLEEQIDPGTAVTIFKELTDRYPQNTLFTFYLARSYYDTGDFHISLRLFEQVQEKSRLTSESWEIFVRSLFTRAMIYERELFDPKLSIRYYLLVLSATGYDNPDGGIPFKSKTKQQEYLHLQHYALLGIGRNYINMRDYKAATYYLVKVEKKWNRRAYELAQEALVRISNSYIRE
jgi:tetratricopeptide (TPR) repeat protein